MCGAISDLTGLGDWTEQKTHTGRGEPYPPVSRSVYPMVLSNKLEPFTDSATNDERYWSLVHSADRWLDQG